MADVTVTLGHQVVAVGTHVGEDVDLPLGVSNDHEGLATGSR
jgi:hypothetical protein